MSSRFAAPVLAPTLALAVILAGPAARAQDDDDDGPAGPPVVVTIQGRCTLTVNDRGVPCRGVAYMVFPSTHRIDFTAITESAGWAFSGEDDDNEDGRYALDVDSVLGPTAQRIDADGECVMEVADDHRTVRSLDCRASTDDGELTLTASGVIAVDSGGGR